MDNPHHLYLEYNRVVRRQERIYRNLVDRQNPLEHFSDVEIFTNFRFRRDTLLDIVNLLQPHLHRPNNRGQPLPPLFQLLLALKFLATNSFHLVTGQALGLPTKCTSWRAMTRVVRALCRICKDHIAMRDVAGIQRKFHLLSGKLSIIVNFPLQLGGLTI